MRSELPGSSLPNRPLGSVRLTVKSRLAPQSNACSAIVELFRGLGIPPAYATSDCGSSPLTIVIEAFAAWAVCSREDSVHRRSDPLDQWQHLGDWGAFELPPTASRTS